ncbi:hypothetical protein BDQ17DRAFT_1275913, partial [Cyathus striatus]
PVPLSSQKHPKLDLRPAPIKHIPSNNTPHHTPSPAKHSSSTSSHSSHSHSKTSSPALPSDHHHHLRPSSYNDGLAPPPEGASTIKRGLHHLVQLAKFYYRGVKLVISRQKEVSHIRARISAGGAPLSRYENRFILTQKNDVSKVVPFVLIALIAEEIIPLIVVFAPSALPSTCILPSQRATIRQKRVEKIVASTKNNRTLFAQLKSLEKPPGHLSLEYLRTPGASAAVCDLLSLSTFGGNALRIRRISRHLQTVAADDKLILQDNLKLSEEELDDALFERGFTSTNLSLDAKEATLQRWLRYVEGPNTEHPISRRLSLLLVRH